MSEQVPKTAAKKKAPAAFELRMDESGMMQRVPVRAEAPRPAIVSAAVKPPPLPAVAAKPLPPDEDELVFDESGELLEGEARRAAIAQAQAQAPVNDDELVFGNSGEILTGDARAKVLADLAEQERKNAEAAAAKAQAKPRDRKESKKAMQISDADDIEKMKLFYRYRAKNPSYFVYTAEGNLEVKEGNSAKIPAMTIPLRAFSDLRPEELEEIEVKQREAQAEIEQAYVFKMKELHGAYEQYETYAQTSTEFGRNAAIESAKKIVALNEQLREISVTRNSALYPERWTKEIDSIDIRKVLLNQPYEQRKMGYPVYLFKRFGLSMNDAVGHYREHGEVVSGTMGGGAETVVLFITNSDDQKTGHFHPTAEREFVYNETKYVSPYQAFETERFKEFDDETMVNRLLHTRSAKTIKNLIAGEQRQPSFPLKLWEEILEALYTQFKDATEKLKETGSARFHMTDKLFGSPEYAIALANVRTKLKEKDQDIAPITDVVKKSVISEGEQKKEKVGAIIHNARRYA
jgi:hypothetical protein